MKVVRETGLETYLEVEGLEVEGLDAVREAFLSPDVTDDYVVEWGEPDRDALLEFLCGRHGFSEDRVLKALDRLERDDGDKTQSRLGVFY